MFARFDLPHQSIDDDVLARRWRSFHRALRRQSNQPGARTLGILLGDDTRRRRWAQRLRDSRQSNRSPVGDARGFLEHARVWPSPVPATPDEIVRSVTVVPVDPTGPSKACPSVLDALRGEKEWLVLVDAGQTIDAATLVAMWQHREDADVVYGDLDNAPWPLLGSASLGPHTLLSENVVTRPTLLRTSTLRTLPNALRSEAGDAWEWDLVLRLREAGARFIHVPLLLGTTPHDFSPTADADARGVIAEALARRHCVADFDPSPRPGLVRWNIRRDEWPMVDVIIPTRDRLDLLRRCIDSIENATTYPNYRITILDNDSAEPATLEYLAATPHRVVACPGPFNYAAIINRGVGATTADLFVTVNNDTTVSTPDWLERMVGVALLDDVGVVGCQQTNNGLHDHDGIIIAPYPQHLRWQTNWFAPDRYVDARRDVVAVTGAVLMVRRDRWESVEGMDENLAVVMNDVDLCLRIQNQGAHVVYLPDVVFEHRASSSRGRLDPITDRHYFMRRWDIMGSFVDPYFPERLRLYGTTIDADPNA
jgi:GT2 family glycosyltransferase